MGNDIESGYKPNPRFLATEVPREPLTKFKDLTHMSKIRVPSSSSPSKQKKNEQFLTKKLLSTIYFFWGHLHFTGIG
jgi:hypothetical protein